MAARKQSRRHTSWQACRRNLLRRQKVAHPSWLAPAFLVKWPSNPAQNSSCHILAATQLNAG